MALFKRGETSLYYEEFGSGYPLLLFAPGGMRSSIEFWHQSPFDPTARLASNFRVIAMDQRNAGKSTAPLTASDGWQTYAADHLALLDHLGIARTHLLGGCIGSSYCLGLIQLAPQRISAAVLQNPIALSETNRELFRSMFDGWAGGLRPSHPEIGDDGLKAFRERMYGGDFVFSVSRDFLKSVSTPLLILAGADQYHPTAVAQEIAKLAPKAELVLRWKEADAVDAAVEKVRSFLKANQ